MEIIDLISILSNSEKTTFVRFLNQRNKNGNNLGIQLFKAYLAEQAPLKQKEWGNNRFRVIKKRLKENLGSFIAENIVETEAQVEVELIKKLLLARKLIQFKKYKSAYSILNKAKEVASGHQAFSILNEIYHSMVECSANDVSLEQEQIATDFQLNLKRYQQQEQRMLAKAHLKKAFREAEYEDKKVDIHQLYERYATELNASRLQVINYKDLLQLVGIADAQGSFTKNYAEVNTYFIQKLRTLEKQEISSLDQLPSHIKLLFLIANIYFRKKEFQKSLTFLAEMKIQMTRENELHFKRFSARYVGLLALNFNFTGNCRRAIVLLDDFLNSNQSNRNNELNPLLIRSMIAFQQNDYKRTAKIFSQFQENDRFYEKQMGKDWLLNKSYIEILLHIELDNLDFVDSRIQSLVKKYGAYLKKKSSFQVLPFLKLVKAVFRNPTIARTTAFHEKVEQQIKRKPSQQEDLFLMCFYAWLKAKMIQQPLYDTTLEMMNTSTIKA